MIWILRYAQYDGVGWIISANHRFALAMTKGVDCFGDSMKRQSNDSICAIRDGNRESTSESYNKIGATMNPKHTDIATIIVPGMINEWLKTNLPTLVVPVSSIAMAASVVG